MALNVAREVHPIAAATGRAHKVLLGEYYNSVWGIGLSLQQATGNIGVMLAGIRAASPTTKVLLQAPTNTQSDVADGHARLDAFTAALLGLPTDGVVRLDGDSHVGHAGDVGDAAYCQGEHLHLTGTAGTRGYGVKAALMAQAFAAVQLG